jgi:hypothetical protein
MKNDEVVVTHLADEMIYFSGGLFVYWFISRRIAECRNLVNR